MRNPRRRSRAAVAVAAAALTGIATLTACDASGGDDAAPNGPSAQDRAGRKAVPEWDASPRSLAAVGDSITRGFDACSVLSDCPEASWATGSDGEVRSLAQRLLGKQRAATHSWNYAKTGARMSDLTGQMEQAAARKPDLVTVMAGANDACRSSVAEMTPVSVFKADFEDALAALRRERPKAQVFVASVPDLKRLWSEGRENVLGKQIWKLGICKTMLQDADATDAASNRRRESVQERVVAYNEVLKEVCAKDLRCRYDGGAVFDFRFGTDHLSHWDWFHPSKSGQARLAEMAYRTITSRRP